MPGYWLCHEIIMMANWTWSLPLPVRSQTYKPSMVCEETEQNESVSHRSLGKFPTLRSERGGWVQTSSLSWGKSHKGPGGETVLQHRVKSARLSGFHSVNYQG